MSFQGKVRTQCPKKCEPWDADVWSFVNAGKDGALREALLAGDLNLVSCPECGDLFYPESTVIYYDAPAELLVFILPESFRAEEQRWRKKMEEDYEQMKKILGEDRGPTRLEPRVQFGMDSFRAELEAEDLLFDEVEIAAMISKEKKWDLYAVERAYARSRSLPWLLPFQGAASAQSISKGLRALLNDNDRLNAYRRWVDVFAQEKSLPPGRVVKKGA